MTQPQSKMSAHCADCKWRKKAEANPKALMSKVWFWHAGWCPGMKAYRAEIEAVKTPKP